MWTIPKINESTRPEPCGNVTITGISHQQAIFCGGYETICLYLIKIDSEDDNAVVILYYNNVCAYEIHSHVTYSAYYYMIMLFQKILLSLM